MDKPDKIRYNNAQSDSNRLRSDFYNTKQWQTIRLIHRKKNPLCEECGGAGVLVHHVKPINQSNAWDTEGGKYGNPTDMRNLQTLCLKCHGMKHKADNKRK